MVEAVVRRPAEQLGQAIERNGSHLVSRGAQRYAVVVDVGPRGAQWMVAVVDEPEGVGGTVDRVVVDLDAPWPAEGARSWSTPCAPSFEQAAKAEPCGYSDVRIAIRAEGGHEANPRVSRATLVVPARMDHRNRMRASRCLDPLRCRPADDVGRAVGRELVLRVRRAAAGVGLIMATMAGFLLGVLGGVLLIRGRRGSDIECPRCGSFKARDAAACSACFLPLD